MTGSSAPRDGTAFSAAPAATFSSVELSETSCEEGHSATV
jgi:hypothetical protein